MSNLCDYSDAYTLDKGTVTVPNIATAKQLVNNNGIEVLFKNCASFTNCINQINSTQIVN